MVKNCVEHTPEGGRIEISYGANALYAEIIVSDDGEGIASRDLPNIFNRFYRGENAGENSVGIGLAQSHLHRPGRRYLHPQPARRRHEL